MPLHSLRPPSTNKQTLAVISQRVQKCTESKRGSHAGTDTDRQTQVQRTRCLLLLLLTGTNATQGEVTGRLKSHLTGTAILISNSLDFFFFLFAAPSTFPRITPNAETLHLDCCLSLSIKR